MIVSGTSTFMFGDGAVLIISSVPGRCACSRSAFLFVGRNGSTRCLECAHLAVAPTECDVTFSSGSLRAYETGFHHHEKERAGQHSLSRAAWAHGCAELDVCPRKRHGEAQHVRAPHAGTL